jgi:ABC-type transport system involved in cytochrome bd biosynthesis fused ATPase/permease subunit
LPAPAFAEGWHAGAALDYVTSLGAHSDASFTPLAMADAVTRIAAEVKVGDLVSVYGTSGPGRPESAHLIHRNAANQDGAIVVSPTTAPAFLLFHFDNQKF